ncbi:MAG: hypothetical protein H6587_10530 [Flavobacteriales bacterium]|nr:hypothetical protein [Flavobacteriales bacterium]MCB9364996.1 hypothetical protein [Flavobacteriales bacterium]
MKKQSKLAIALLVAFPISLLTSCSDDPKPTEDVAQVVEEVVEEENKSYYQIPSPDEMFGFIKESGLKYNSASLNPIQNITSYNDPKSQALNFGIYSADLAYTAAFEEYQESIKYFGSIQKLGDQIGLSAAFDKSLIERIQNNLDNADSLVAITNTSYFSVVDYLEQNEQGDKLGLVASAGWLETVYIAANTINYDKDKAAVERLADQKLTLDNLIAYLEKYSENTDVKEVLEMFKDLETTFAILNEVDSGTGISLKKKEGGKMVLGGGSSIKITKDQFEAIKAKISEIRNNIVKTEA